MKWDIIIFDSDGLWGPLGYGNFHALFKIYDAVGLDEYFKNQLRYTFPYQCYFHGHFVLCRKVEVNPTEIYKMAEEFDILLAVVPHSWGPPVNRKALMRFLDEEEDHGCIRKG
jgi:hypothetical protein